MHLAVGRMTTEETDVWTLCMPLPSAGLVGASSSAGSGQNAASAVGAALAGGESHGSWPAATEAVQWCGAGKICEWLTKAAMAEDSGIILYTHQHCLGLR